MKKIWSLTFALLVLLSVQAQKYYTKSGKIILDATAKASPERIEAVNRSATCILDSKSGQVQFAVLMKGFEFDRALMQEHFNENYVESEKFPRAEFRGMISNNGDVNYQKDGTYKVNVRGQLTLHGQTKEVMTGGTVVVQNGRIAAAADFDVLLKDYQISIPGLVSDKVATTAKISVTCSLELFKG